MKYVQHKSEHIRLGLYVAIGLVISRSSGKTYDHRLFAFTMWELTDVDTECVFKTSLSSNKWTWTNPDGQ